MAIDPILQAAEEYLRGLTTAGYRPQYYFTSAEDTSGEGSGPSSLYVRPTTPWEQEHWGNPGWFTPDDDLRDVTSQALQTGTAPGGWRAVTDAEIAADPQLAQDWDVWNQHLGQFQRRQEPFNLFTSDIFPALAAVGLSTGLAGALGAFSPPASAAGAAGLGAADVGGSVAPLAVTPALNPAVSAPVWAGPAAGAGMAGAGGAGAGLTAGGGASGTAVGGLAGTAAGGGMGLWELLAPALVQGGTSLVGGLLGANAATNAGETQARAAQEANALLAAIYAQQRADMAPWREAGVGALGQLTSLVQSPSSPSPYQAPGAMDIAPYDLNQLTAQSRFAAPVGVLDPAQYAWQAPPALNPASFAFAPPSGADVLRQDPGYQFRQDEARRALEASAAARGGLLSGSTLRGVTDLSQTLASQEYQNAYNRLLGQNQLAYQRALQENTDVYGRRLTANQLAYGRGYQQNQDIYGRGLTENQLNYERLLAANQGQFGRAYQADQDAYQRALQQYMTNYNVQQGQRQQQYNELAGLSGTGQTSATGLAQLGGTFGTQQANNLLSGAASQAAGGMGASNAWTGALGGVGTAANSYLQNALLQQLLQRRS